MNQQDARAIVTIASLAAMSDGDHDEAERAEVGAVAERLGVPHEEIVLADPEGAPRAAALVAARLSSDEARAAAYQVAAAVCAANGYATTRESIFLRGLAQSMGVDATRFDGQTASAAHAVEGWLASTSGPGRTGGTGGTGSAEASGALDEFILDQAMLSAALELLPDRIANLGILPLQLRLVHVVGQRSGQAVDGVQVKELLATLGIGVAAQVMESVVRRTLGGLAGGLLGGLLGGAAGMAAGGAVTFATTYALGHAAQQYYAQGRAISQGDLLTLFERLKQDGASVYPRVQSRIAELARGNSLQSIMQAVRGDAVTG